MSVCTYAIEQTDTGYFYGAMSDFKPGDLLRERSDGSNVYRKVHINKIRTHPDKCIAVCGRTSAK